ncbi:MAG: hypothetical protein WA958_15820 [Tunicatimonas sp.]
MKTFALTASIALLYTASLAQDSLHQPPWSSVNLPDKTEVKQQQRRKLGDLKGPRAKNYPAHRYHASPVKVKAPRSEKRMGPAAKNYRPWHTDNSRHHLVVTKEKEDLKGPRAKNRKP